MLVFIDDSGDPGFKVEKGSSKVFVIAMVIFKDNLEAERASLTIKELRRKLKMSDLSEFKFNKSSKSYEHFEKLSFADGSHQLGDFSKWDNPNYSSCQKY